MTAKQYIKEIVERSCLPREERKRIKKDLENEIFSAIEGGESMERIVERMGTPDEVAVGLFENYIDIPTRPFCEYKSKKTLFGLPLVHIISGSYKSTVTHVRTVSARGINIGGRCSPMPYHYSLPTARGVFAFGPKAKGIFAVGNLSMGVISIGNLSVGIISIGNLSVGLLNIGNLALAGLISLGNAAIGVLSGGNVALGFAAAGNVAAGNFAVGNKTAGTLTFSISDLAAQLEQIKAFFAGLDAPAIVKAYFGMVEKALGLFSDPLTAMPLIITSSTMIMAIILALAIIPHRLLRLKSK